MYLCLLFLVSSAAIVDQHRGADGKFFSSLSLQHLLIVTLLILHKMSDWRGYLMRKAIGMWNTSYCF